MNVKMFYRILLVPHMDMKNVMHSTLPRWQQSTMHTTARLMDFKFQITGLDY